MKLVTFQSREAFEYLQKHGYLICDDKEVNTKKYGKSVLFSLSILGC